MDVQHHHLPAGDGLCQSLAHGDLAFIIIDEEGFHTDRDMIIYPLPQVGFIFIFNDQTQT